MRKSPPSRTVTAKTCPSASIILTKLNIEGNPRR